MKSYGMDFTNVPVTNFDHENVTTLPASPTIGRTVLLTATDGSHAPGLYTFDGSAWSSGGGGGAGTITGITAGTGLTGGGTTGGVTLAIDSTVALNPTGTNINYGAGSFAANTVGLNNVVLGANALADATGSVTGAITSATALGMTTRLFSSVMPANGSQIVISGTGLYDGSWTVLSVNGTFFRINTPFLGNATGTFVQAAINNTVVGYNSGRGLTVGGANTILGANVTKIAASTNSNIILADGTGTIKLRNHGGVWSTYNPLGSVTIQSGGQVTGVAGVASTTGGTIAAGTYYASVNGVDMNGNYSIISSESAAVTTTGSTSSITWSWNVVPGITTYFIYITSTSGSYSWMAAVAATSLSAGASYVQTLPFTSLSAASFAPTPYDQTGSLTVTGQMKVAGGQNLGSGPKSYSNSNVCHGTSAHAVLTTGTNNVAIGNNAHNQLTIGSGNTSLGNGAGAVLSTANYNTLVGQNAGQTITTGSNNIIIGSASNGYGIVAGTNNVFLGGSSVSRPDPTGWIVIGDGNNDRMWFNASYWRFVNPIVKDVSNLGPALSDVTLDFSLNKYYVYTSLGDHTLSVNNWPVTNIKAEIEIEILNASGGTITLPAGYKVIKSDGTFATSFAGAGITFTSDSDFLKMWTRDGGTTVYVKVLR